ncbi:CDP-alcohol phosphatidyltransferase family protein [Roseococcus pinisoli]|uniref:CDP-diacylglycerol--glycerol-3-phosphate 3-phosphatidyltransferase n=1 Tax=Roseococcus pinisoli TaxID=2835040 RepID=A0ABS5QIL2_9PROT|nr:CDP-alcohol phosphatidyltransferase family protein [Roseococcus pinisoli]MBS7813191.1 CDP-alcohol phosphatidyltransferase family protein [Roseococcus pinisoli]
MLPEGPSAHHLLTLPNLITMARLAAVPATIWLILHHRLDMAFLLFVAAGVSDALDGWLARYTDSRTVIGALLDPVADKALLVSVYVTLAVMGVLPDWLAILVVFRDVTIVGGLLLLWVLGARTAIKPLYVSKLNTAMQLILAGIALFQAGFGVGLGPTLVILIWLTAATTAWSGIAYIFSASRWLKAPSA